MSFYVGNVRWVICEIHIVGICSLPAQLLLLCWSMSSVADSLIVACCQTVVPPDIDPTHRLVSSWCLHKPKKKKQMSREREEGSIPAPTHPTLLLLTVWDREKFDQRYEEREREKRKPKQLYRLLLADICRCPVFVEAEICLSIWWCWEKLHLLNRSALVRRGPWQTWWLR